MTDAPKPYPTFAGVSTKSGIRRNDEYMPKPSRAATAFVVQTPRMRIIRMSTSGCRDRTSLHTQATRPVAPAASRTTVRAEPQCQTGASLTATSRAASPIDISTAPTQFALPRTRSGDSGTKSWIATVAGTSRISGSQKR